MAVGNRFELIDTQEYLGQDCLNVYWYKQTAGLGGSSAELRALWQALVLPLVLSIQNTFIAHVAIATRNVDIPPDFELFPLIPNQFGNQIGEGLPAFNAWSFRMVRTEQGVHHGAKRIAGISENSQSQGQPTAGFQANLDNYAAILNDDLVGGTGNTYRPVIMRRLLDALGHLIGFQDHPMGATLFVRMSTQNSRKVGQ